MKTSFAFCLVICAWRATAADSVERQFPKTSSVFDNANTQSASFDSANTQSAPFGSTNTQSTSFDATTSNNGGFGADGNQGQSDDRQLLRDLFTRFNNMKNNKNTDRRSEVDDVMTSTVTCTFPGDDAPNLTDYCKTLILYSFDALDAGVGSSTWTLLPDGNSIDGNSATVRFLCHYKGKGLVLNMDVDRKMTWEFLLVKQPDGAWKVSHFSVLGDDQGSYAKLKNAGTGLLRDAIVSAKQSYPAYNPIFVVAGSGMAGFLSIGIVGAYLIHRRRTYKRVASVSNV